MCNTNNSFNLKPMQCVAGYIIYKTDHEQLLSKCSHSFKLSVLPCMEPLQCKCNDCKII